MLTHLFFRIKELKLEVINFKLVESTKGNSHFSTTLNVFSGDKWFINTITFIFVVAKSFNKVLLIIQKIK